MQRILDLCCGRVPWIARNFIWRLDGVGTELSDRFSSVPSEALYLCLDNDASILSQGQVLVNNIRKIDANVFLGGVKFLQSDARAPGLSQQSFDVVILADFINAPPVNYNYGGEKASVGLSDKIKREVVESAIALLKSDGLLIVAFYETSQYARYVLDYLTKEPRLVLVEQCGDLDETFGRSKRCIYELAFEKASQSIIPRFVPINEKQRAYLKKLATEDEVVDLGDLNDLFDQGYILPA